MSNLLKQCFIVNSDKGARIINSNARVSQRMEEISAERLKEEQAGAAARAEGDFAEGIEASAVEIDTAAIKRQVLDQAGEEAQQILSAAKEDANRIIEDAKSQAEAEFAEQKRLGYEEGVREKEEALNRQMEEREQSLALRQQELEETFKSRFSTMESDIVDAVISVFDKVFQIQFEDKRELLLALLNGTLMDIDPGEKIRIHVNFEDQKMLSGHIDEIQEITGKDVAIEFVKDQKLSDGQCKIETDYGVVDCGIDTQLSSLLKDIRSLCR